MVMRRPLAQASPVKQLSDPIRSATRASSGVWIIMESNCKGMDIGRCVTTPRLLPQPLPVSLCWPHRADRAERGDRANRADPAQPSEPSEPSEPTQPTQPP